MPQLASNNPETRWGEHNPPTFYKQYSIQDTTLEVFSKDWFLHRMAIVTDTAGKRYTPELHVDLPITFVFEGLSLSGAYWSKFYATYGAMIRASRKIDCSSLRRIGLIRKLRSFEQALRTLEQLIPDRLDPPQRVRQEEMINATEECLKSILELSSPLAWRNTVGNAKFESVLGSMSLHWLKYDLSKLRNAIHDFQVFLRSDATKAASRGTLLLDGEAGQGKTHLFCDIGHRAVEAGRPVVVLFGGQLSGRNVWSEIAERLGLETLGSETLIGAMHAAAEASNAPFLLLIDALNDAARPHDWQNELPSMLAEIAQDPWIRLGVSVRSAYMQIVYPSDGISGIVRVTHQGFEGREADAMDLFFSTFGLQQPRIPLLTPEFTNPLFLKLYCEGLEKQGLAAPNQGGAHITQVFDWYLSSKATRIASRLQLDPAASTVERALSEFSLETANRNSDYLERERAEQIFSKFAPHLYKWPNTLLGQLLSEGVLSADLAYSPDFPTPKQVIRFTYQRFADYRVALSLLQPYGDDSTRLRNTLSAGKSLRKKVLNAPPGWIEALSVFIPERFNRELLDVVNWRLGSARRQMWNRALIKSISSRRPLTVTQRTRELLATVDRKFPSLRASILETILSVAPFPEHPLNAEALHRMLKRLTMPSRDVAWSIPTYFDLDQGGALDRLLRWAANGPYANVDGEVLRLAGLTIAWTFTSPNRMLRDYATKVLVRLMSGNLAVLSSLIDEFDGVDDPYVIERLAVVTHGTLLCGGAIAHEKAAVAAKAIRRVAFAKDQVPNIITRDAVRGTYEWCKRNGLITASEYAEVLPPYDASEPEKPKTRQELEDVFNQRTARRPRY